ncbi:MAG TPA: PAN domain-containing protein [Hyphomicrobiaceae bacterium]|nr:PAN domain-containing protein [Hyphomicrobiaceae bacterium]
MGALTVPRIFTIGVLCLLLAILHAVAPAVAGPADFAIIIGNGRYKNGVPEVKYAHNDMTAVAKAAEDVFAIPAANVRAVPDISLARFNELFGSSYVTPAGRQSFLESIVSDETKVVLIYYSGHGVPGVTGGKSRPHLLPIGSDPMAAAVSAYALDDLIAATRAVLERKAPKARAIIIVDACFSGTSDGGTLTPGTSGTAFSIDFNALMNDRVTVITAAGGAEVAYWDTDRKHGLFTSALLDGLYGAADKRGDGGDGDFQLTIKELQSFTTARMTTRLSALYPREFKRQSPTFPSTSAAVLVTFEGRYPERRLMGREQEERQCRFFEAFGDKQSPAVLEQFLATCGGGCRCRSAIEALLKRHTAKPSTCEADRNIWELARTSRDLVQLQFIADHSGCPEFRAAAEAMMADARGKAKAKEDQIAAEKARIEREQRESERLAEERRKLAEKLAEAERLRLKVETDMIEERRKLAAAAADAARTPPPSYVMSRLTGRYVEGDGDLDASFASSYAECTARCISNDRCFGIEFYKPKMQCNLYSSARWDPRPSSDGLAEVAVKRAASSTVASMPVPTYSPPVASAAVTRIPRAYFKEDSTWRTAGTSFEDCTRQCEAGAGCVAFEFYRPRRQCILFRFLPTVVRDAGSNAEIGQLNR